MTHKKAALLGAGFCIAAGFLSENPVSSLRDAVEAISILGVAGAVSGWTAATTIQRLHPRALRVLAASASGALSGGLTGVIVGSVYFVLANPHDGLSFLGGLFAGMYAFVAGLLAGAIIGAQG